MHTQKPAALDMPARQAEPISSHNTIQHHIYITKSALKAQTEIFILFLNLLRQLDVTNKGTATNPEYR